MDKAALRREIASRSTSAERLLEIARLDPALARLIPRLRGGIPAEVYRELASSRDMPTRAAVARDPEAPLEILAELVRDRQWTVVKAVFEPVARRPAPLPDSLFEQAASHPRHTVRQRVAEHPLCPAGALARLATDPAPEVRRAVAGHPRAGAALLRQLAADSDLIVVWSVARHPSVDEATLDLLAGHPHPHTRRETISPFLSAGGVRSIPLARLARLAEDDDRDVLEQIVDHREAPTWLVEQILVRRPDLFTVGPPLYIRAGTVYGSLASEPLAMAAQLHTDLSEALLARIAEVRGTRVAFVLLAHPRCGPDLVARVAQTQIEHLAELRAAPPPPGVGDDERQLHGDLCEGAALALAWVAARAGLPEELRRAIGEALGGAPQPQHVVNQLRASPYPELRALAGPPA